MGVYLVDKQGELQGENDGNNTRSSGLNESRKFATLREHAAPRTAELSALGLRSHVNEVACLHGHDENMRSCPASASSSVGNAELRPRAAFM